MSFLLRSILRTISLAALLTSNAFAQEFPTRNIDFIVPFSPGGGSDNIVRALQPSLEKALGQTIVIRNIAGGGGAVGYSRLVRAEPDGYSITTTNNAIFTLSSFSDAPFVNADFDHLARVAVMPYILAVRNNTEWTDLESLRQDLKQNNRKLSVGFSGVGSSTHITAHAIANALDMEFLFIPYSGGTAAVSSAMGGHIDAVVLNPSEILSAVDAGKLKPILSTGSERSIFMPDIPTLKELGFDLELEQWRGVSAPKGLSPQVKNAYVSAIKIAVQDPRFIQTIEASSTEVRPLFGQELDDFIRATEEIILPIVESVK